VNGSGLAFGAFLFPEQFHYFLFILSGCGLSAESLILIKRTFFDNGGDRFRRGLIMVESHAEVPGSS